VGIDPGLFRENERTAPSEAGRRFFEAGPLRCELGGELPSVRVCYETWGALSLARDNAILVCHALSGDAHCVGWWSRLVGPGRAIDTDRYFVIGSNALGGCQGTTGPASLAPDGRPWGSRFPQLTVGDMVAVQRRLIAHLGIERLLLTAGGSMGGMQALEWARTGGVAKAWITASAAAHGAMQIGFNETARQAILRDPKYMGGDYEPDNPPNNGLAVARMLGHLTYLSHEAFDSKFGRQVQDPADFRPYPQRQVESYLNYQGDKFTGRFDANSFIVLTRAIDLYECRSLEGSTTEFLFTSFTSDWIYPSRQSRELHEMALAAGCRSAWVEIDLPYGHDAFLLDDRRQGPLVRKLLAARPD
jgi:homoserine O-acetyltransferase